jgi:hypothetical protein
LIWCEELGGALEQRRLPRACRADDRNDLSVVDVEVDVEECVRDGPASGHTGAILLLESSDHEQWGAWHRFSVNDNPTVW